MSKLTLSFKGKVLKVFPIMVGSMTLGSDPDCNIHIDSLALQPQHSKIDTMNNESVISDMGTEEGTFVSHKKIEGSQILKDGDIINVGKHTLSFSFSETEIVEKNIPKEEVPAAAADNIEKSQGWLQIMNGTNLGKTMSLNKAMTNLGKPGISTAVITKRQDGYFISQLEGDHPLLITDKTLGEKSQQLIDGDTIQIGNIKMQFYLE